MTKKIFFPFFFLFAGAFFISCRDDNVQRENYPNGTLRLETPRNEGGEKEGIEREFYESGNIKRETPFVNGIREGLEKEYYENGQLKSESPYSKGYLEGEVKRFHKNGALSFRAQFSANKQTEFGTRLDENGEMETHGTFKDSRDGRNYEWIKIEEQIWLAENLQYAPVEGSLCMQCNNWGRLYDFSSAKSACPQGFHLPSDADWKRLFSTVGKGEGKKLKAGFGWDPLKNGDFGNGTDDFGFGAKAGGAHFERSAVPQASRKFRAAGQKAYFWSADGRAIVFHYDKDMATFEKFNALFGASVRCVLD